MKTSSAKSKGRRLQQRVAKDIAESLLLEADDAREAGSYLREYNRVQANKKEYSDKIMRDYGEEAFK